MDFRTLDDVQDVSKIHAIFSHGIPLTRPDTPLFVVVVGAPGVGKTTQIKKILHEHKYEYDQFYNVSLDSLVERVIPYRITTKLLYDEMRKKRGIEPLTDGDYAVLNEVYMATIRSRDRMFDSNYTVHRILNKIEGRGKREKEKARKTHYKTLTELRKEGLEYGIKEGYNIIYDTTFSSTKNVMGDDILPLLEKQKNITYQVLIVHVTSTEKQIRKQLNHRHKQMVKEGYIRAIGPKLTKKFIKENEEGMKNAEEYCNGGYQEEHSLTRYTPEHFIFKTVFNQPKPTPLSHFPNDDYIEQEIIRSPRANMSTRKKKNTKVRNTIRNTRKLH